MELRLHHITFRDGALEVTAADASVRAIGDAVQLNCRTVSRWLAAGALPDNRRLTGASFALPERRAPTVRRHDTLIAPFATAVQEHLRSGVQNGAALYRMLRERGYRGSAMTVRRELERLRRLDCTNDEELQPEHHTYVELVGERIPALVKVRRVALAFAQMLKTHHVDAFHPLLNVAHRSDLASFVRGVERDYAAVLAAIIFRWNNG